ncbi:putative phosphodiesterase [Paraburkholderia sp. JPY158]|uniref:Putative phosphodiesterase n=1 Tax=Paraburkholderia atlantica TaxID=2654982 RepID=A0A7W8V9R4_PARAM|nr:metallophosphoesterase [Paraburkholderia atlantica]MBB5428277.1 putative phosphodiesterase [Paraburkholderia atlantica]
MRFQIASDLHLEMLYRFPGCRVIEPAPDADALILAGDIHSHTHGIRMFSDWPVPVFYVHGNHECYGAHYYAVIKELKRVAAAAGIQYLERDVVSLPSVRILGTCLWTDYAVDGHASAAMREAQRCIRDHSVIRVNEGQDFTPTIARSEHIKSRSWLQQQLALPFAGKTVVITHHGPHRKSVHSRYAGDLLNAAFVSDLTPLVEQADLWVHGHVHDSFDYKVGKCRVVANPRGYARNRLYADELSQVEWENFAFDPLLVVEI